jgi:hypothetical protein
MAFKPAPKPIENWFDDRISHWGLNLSYAEEAVLSAVLDDFITAYSFKPITAKRRKALGKLILNLSYLDNLTNSKACLNILLGNSNSGSETIQYRIFGCTGQLLSDCVSQMEASGLIRFKVGYNITKIKGANHASKLKLNDTSRELIADRLSIEKMTVDRASILYGSSDNEALVPKPSIGIKSREGLIKKYNSLLSNTSISVGQCPLYGPEKSIFRKFSNKSCAEGGRLYGAIYQRIPKGLRRGILIAGQPTSEVDIKSTHPLIAYALEGIDMTRREEGFRPIDTGNSGDPYGAAPLQSKREADRGFIKGLLIKMFNVNCSLSEKSESEFINAVVKTFEKHDETGSGAALLETHFKELALTPVFDESGNETGLRNFEPEIIDFSVATVIKNIIERHAPIRHRFGSGAWRVFDFYESRILLRVIEHFTLKGIPCLSVHDSVLIAEEYEEELVELFKKSIETEFCKEGFKFANRDKLVDVVDKTNGADWDDDAVFESLQETRFTSIYFS